MPKIADPALLQQLNAPQINPTVALDRQYKQGQIEGQQADLRNKPIEAVKLRAEAAAAQAAVARAPYQNQEAQANAAKALAEAQRANGPQLTAEVRKAAIDGYYAAKFMDHQIADMEAKFKGGPGATTGLKGLTDYLPYTANQLFDNAGDAVRGNVGAALNFTGGQLNTPREAEAAVGPYLPHASDRDAVALDKIARLKELRDKAVAQSIQTLGGIPDAQGNVLPVAEAKKQGLFGAVDPGASAPPPPGNTPPPGAPPVDPMGGPSSTPMGVATGQTRLENDPKASALLDMFIRKGATADEINAAITPLGFGAVDPKAVQSAQAYLKAHPGYQGSFGLAQKQVDNGLFSRAAATAPGAYSINAADALTAGFMDNATGNPADTRAKMEALSAAHPSASMMGGITGAGLGAAGAELGLGALGARVPGVAGRALASARTADGAYGSLYGAGSSDDNRVAGALLGGASGTLGGMFGRGLARGAGNVARGVTDASVNYLHDLGVPLTVGQALGQSGRVGNIVRRFENGLSGLPIVGDMVKARQSEGFQGFNRAAFDHGLAPVNGTTNGEIGAHGVDLARQGVSDAYHRTLDPVSLSADAPFLMDNSGTQMAADALPADMAHRAGYAIDRASENFDPNANISGTGFQQALRRFRRTTNENAPLPNGADLGDVMGQAEDAYTGLVQRQAPGVMPEYLNANAANRNVSVLKDAVNRARNGTRSGETGTFTPSQLNDAAAGNARRFGGTQGTTQQPFFELTQAGQKVLPSNVPDSGTGFRIASLGLPAALGGAGATGGYALGDTTEGAKYGLGLGALAAAGGSKTAQKMLISALLDRPDWLRLLADRTAQRAPAAGMAFAGLGSSLAPAFVPSN
jgi:hypothetical protein